MNTQKQVHANASPLWKKFAMGATASAVVVAGLASAANVDPIPAISNTFAVAGEVVKSADINKLAESINLLDVRTNNFKDNITVIDDGNVGIGTATPSQLLSVGDGTGAKYAKIDGGNSGNTAGAALILSNGGTDIGGIGNASSINGGAYDPNMRVYSATDMSFSTGAASTPKMYINADGNVGIGTTEPQRPLHVVSSSDFGLGVQSTDTYAGIALSDTVGSASIGFNEENLFFKTGGIADSAWGQGAQERMTILKDGNVGIGTTEPKGQLHVSSAEGYVMIQDTDAVKDANRHDNVIWYSDSTNTPTAKLGFGTLGQIFYLQNLNSGGSVRIAAAGGATSHIEVVSTGNVGIGITSPTAKLHVNGDALATVWNTTSDERKKENIEVVENALEKISDINGVSFTWKEGGLETYGLIAQNVETVFPELVTTADDEMGTKSVNYDGMIGPMVQAIKELNAENEAKDDRIDDLEAEITAIKAMLQ